MTLLCTQVFFVFFVVFSVGARRCIFLTSEGVWTKTVTVIQWVPSNRLVCGASVKGRDLGFIFAAATGYVTGTGGGTRPRLEGADT